MLKQILRDMYVDPEILAGLDETYKQILFCKMREEQIRRWRIWDEEQQQNEIVFLSKTIKTNDDHDTEMKNNEKNFHISRNHKKHVSFRLGEDGEPWVWVMGEHTNDLTIEDILEEEAKQKARQLAENEFRKMNAIETVNLSDIIIDEFDKKQKVHNNNGTNQNNVDLMMINETPKIEDFEIYCSVDELKNDTNKFKSQSSLTSFKQIQNSKNNLNNSIANAIRNDKIDVLQEISSNKPSMQKVSARIALWEQRTIGQRTSEIFKQMQKRKQEAVKEAEEAAKHEEELWKEQERKAKQAEIQMREIARRAREEHRKSINCDEKQISTNTVNNTDTVNSIHNANSNYSSPLSSLDLSISRPQNQDAVINWYRTIEFPRKTGLNSITNKPEKWFHGLLTRTDAERLLLNEEQGTFLIRISEKIWGYAISYKDVDRCKHYLIDASNTKYKFLGQNQLEYDSLGDLLRHHANVPITILGNELLLRPCPSAVGIPPILKDLV